MEKSNPWVCIDFGTCNSAAAIEVDGEPHLVAFGNSQYFPTVACVLPDGTIEVCQNAEPLRRQYAETFKQEFKLQIADVLDINRVTYTELVAEILAFIKGCAETENNGRPLTCALLTVPALYTDEDPRKAVMAAAARKAGFTTVEFMTEPQAAARHYARVCGAPTSGLTLIYDLGGGTFDPALLELSPKGSTPPVGHGGAECGGHFFDKAIYDCLRQRFADTDTPLLRSGRLDDYEACRRLKETLSVREKASALLSNSQTVSMTRAEFNTLITPLLELTLKACDNLLATAGRCWADVSQVLLVGGSTAIPLIGEMLQAHLESHQASQVKIIRNVKGPRGDYNHRFATSLGGIDAKIAPPPPPQEKPGIMTWGERTLQLHEGDNTFGRGDDMEFRFDDPTMSRHHFTLTVTRDATGRLNYTITTRSASAATIINNTEALDRRYAPISRVSAPLADNSRVTAGRTTLIFKKNHS